MSIEAGGAFNPSSGAASFTGYNMGFNINQTGTASGDIIGFNHEPLLTSILGKNIAYRAVTGQVLFGASTVTANTRLDVRGLGTTTNLALRIADSGNTLRMSVLDNGQINTDKTITAGGTTGAQTIDKVQGSVNFAAAATTLVVTNALVTTSSNVFVQVYGTDATATSARVTLASGSFTITLNAAATAETKVGFFVLN